MGEWNEFADPSAAQAAAEGDGVTLDHLLACLRLMPWRQFAVALVWNTDADAETLAAFRTLSAAGGYVKEDAAAVINALYHQ